MPWTPDLLARLKVLGVEPNAGQLEALDGYARLLAERGRTLNLLSAGDLERIYDRHFIDSLSAAALVDWSGKVAVDIGTGAGLPGLPLAITLPEASFVLVDRTRKRISFIEHVIRKLGLRNAIAVWGSVEDVGRDPDHSEQADVATVRAVTDTAAALALADPLLRAEGRVLLWQSAAQWADDPPPAGWAAEWRPTPGIDTDGRGIRMCWRNG